MELRLDFLNMLACIYKLYIITMTHVAMSAYYHDTNDPNDMRLSVTFSYYCLYFIMTQRPKLPSETIHIQTSFAKRFVNFDLFRIFLNEANTEMFSRFRRYVFNYDLNLLWFLFKCAIFTYLYRYNHTHRCFKRCNSSSCPIASLCLTFQNLKSVWCWCSTLFYVFHDTSS